MIILLQYVAIKSKASDKLYYVERRYIDKFPNDFDFGIDIFTPGVAQRFLQQLDIDGEPLPRVNEFGEPYVYSLFVRGRSRSMPFKLAKNGRPSPMYNLFPGYRDDKRLELFPHGVLD